MEHKNVRQLVPDHPLELIAGPVVGNDHPPFDEFKKSPHPLGDEIGNGIRLLEVKVGGIKDERNFFQDGKVEFLLQKLKAYLRIMGPCPGQFLLLGIIIDVEMIGLQHLPVKIGVLDLVAAEVILTIYDRSHRNYDKKYC